MPVLAIVGLGPAGVFVLSSLVEAVARSGPGDVEVLVFDPSPAGDGVAYGTPVPTHVINMRADTMSLDSDPEGFTRWMTERSWPLAGSPVGDPYPPRAVFGQYIRDHAERLVATAGRHGVKVHILRDEVVDAEVFGSGAELRTATGSAWAVDQVAFCLGELKGDNFPHLSSCPEYMPDPWDTRALSDIHRHASVGVIGTSLTAVDVVMSLADNGHRGQVWCAARARTLPKVQGPYVVPKLTYTTREVLRELTEGGARQLSLDTVAAQFRAEIEAAYGRQLDWSTVLVPETDDVRDSLARDIETAQAGEARWYWVLDATAEVLPAWWDALRRDDQRRFLEQYGSLWAMYRHSMPLPNARRLLRLAQSGRLSVDSGLRTIEPDLDRAAGLVLGFDSGEAVRVDHVIDATGLPKSLAAVRSPLIANLVDRGHIREHPLGGVDVEFSTLRSISRDGAIQDNCFFVGPITKGVHFYTQAIEMVKGNAEVAAETMWKTVPSSETGTVTNRVRSSVA